MLLQQRKIFSVGASSTKVSKVLLTLLGLASCLPLVHSLAGQEMSWFCSGRSNSELVNNLFRAKIISKERVKNAMLAVDRGDFVSSQAYTDSPQPIGVGATISAPHMHAYALELLEHKLKSGARALDVGSGSGYLTVAFAKMVCSCVSFLARYCELYDCVVSTG
eukprot:gb/GECG01007341.1/.p1 GENE.gb/GECG01007341.1/~~gb/GECG01007341.1/.p1  ORF type:complete len:164 (+),score=15.05 gb/GECG01007341.1/:1-492(+)